QQLEHAEMQVLGGLGVGACHSSWGGTVCLVTVRERKPWVPAFAGMTGCAGMARRQTARKPWVPAFAGMTTGNRSTLSNVAVGNRLDNSPDGRSAVTELLAGDQMRFGGFFPRPPRGVAWGA